MKLLTNGEGFKRVWPGHIASLLWNNEQTLFLKAAKTIYLSKKKISFSTKERKDFQICIHLC